MRRSCRRIREASAAADRPVAILQDLSGPKIRIGPLAAPFALAPGDRLVIERGDFAGEPGRVSSAAEALFTSVAPGVRLLVDDGRIELEVVSASSDRLVTTVTNGGTLQSSKGINVPDVPLRTPALTPKDLADLRAGIAMGVDVVAISFVQSADDLTSARAAVSTAGAPDMPIVAKIEKPQAVADIEAIVRRADGLMVARGDLGIELPLETRAGDAAACRARRPARRRPGDRGHAGARVDADSSRGRRGPRSPTRRMPSTKAST